MTMNRRSLRAFLMTITVLCGVAGTAGAQQLDSSALTGAVGLRLPHVVEVDHSIRPSAPVVAAPNLSSASRPKILPALYVSLAALQAFDASSTLKGLGQGAVEGNALVAGVASRPAAWIAVKSATTVSTILLTERLWKRNRTAAIILMAALNGGYAAVAISNHRTIGR